MFETKVCPFCGNQVRQEAVFCLDCGKRVDGHTEQLGEAIEDTNKIETAFTSKPLVFDDLFNDDLMVETDAAAFFKVVEGVDKGLEIPLKGRVYIGRIKRGEGVALSDPFVSRQHLIVNKIGEDYILENLSKTNGTAVNGRRVVNEHTLVPGDLVEIGYTVMSFRLKTD